MGAEPDHWPLPSLRRISKTSVPPAGPGTTPELLFERKKRADEAWDAHIATDTVSCGDGGRPRRDVGAEKEESESRGSCWASARPSASAARTMHAMLSVSVQAGLPLHHMTQSVLIDCDSESDAQTSISQLPPHLSPAIARDS